jgi:C-terminal processing protease CtpA/Prc
MKVTRFIIPAAVILLLAGQAVAQTQAEAERAEAAAAAERAKAAAAVEQTQRKAETHEAEVARKLEEAERRMAEAAQQIAELASERLPQLAEMERRFEFIADGRPRLGVNIGDVNSDGPVEGVKIVGVTPGTAADDAGLRAGDVITAINGDSMSAESAREASQLVLDFMQGVEEGDILEVEYIRDGKVGSVEVEPRSVDIRAYAFGGVPRDFSMRSAPEVHVVPEMAEKFRFAWAGNVWADMELVELNEGLGKYFGTDSGVLVVSAPESDSLQFEDGDVILSIDGREPTSVRHAMRILGSYQSGESLEIKILREKKKRTLEIEIPDDRSSMNWVPAPEPRPAAAPRPPRVPKPDSEET